MSLSSPNLDDRTFEQLVAEAKRRVRQTSREWTDLSESDPGMVLLELFAHLTETMIYRLNRLPEKAYIEFLRLIGVTLHPPAAARVRLRFRRSPASGPSVEIPRHTRVTVERADEGQEPPVFVTAAPVRLPAGEASVDVEAFHCEPVEAELAGISTGLPAQRVVVRRPPIVEATGDGLALVVGVEAGEREEAGAALRHGGKTYTIWEEVDSFATSGPDDRVYVADRAAGAVTFAPALRQPPAEGGEEGASRALAALPPAGREIRVWYRRGGGGHGNAAAGTLTVLKDPIPGLEVVNPHPAAGGRDGESLSNALVRGPQELHTLHRAVTARDFELVAAGSKAVARAKALTQADHWAHALPGTVEVLVVPDLPGTRTAAGRVSAGALHERQAPGVLEAISGLLDERRPLGTACVVHWARYKEVRVTARVRVRAEEDGAAVRQRVLDRLYRTISPLPGEGSGWPFGQALRASHVFDIALKEPGVRWVDRVRLHVDDVPEKQVTTVASDAFQQGLWYAGSGNALYRSLNDGDGWEPVRRFEGEEVRRVAVHRGRAGLLAVVTDVAGEGGARIHLSNNCGESWAPTPYATAFRVRDAAWVLRDDQPALLLAADTGLYELVPGGGPVQIALGPSAGAPGLGFWAVAAHRDEQGQDVVAVAAMENRGVFLSCRGGRPNSFRAIGLEGTDVRTLAVQYQAPVAHLWAGASVEGGPDDPGQGCFSWEVVRCEEDPPEGWVPHAQGWDGGSCRGLAFLEDHVLAGSHHRGVLVLKLNAKQARWLRPDVNCGLPLRDQGRFHPVEAVAASRGSGLVLACCVEGVYRSRNATEGETVRYASRSGKEFSEVVTLPPTWLFCSGEHEIELVEDDEAG